LINLDISRPAAALEAFEKAYEIRTGILPSNDAFLAANQVNIGLAYTELGELETARAYLQQSIDIRLLHNSDRIGNSYSNMASLLLRMEKPDEAEAMLKSCPSLTNFSDETFLKTGNPRFSGFVTLSSNKCSRSWLTATGIWYYLVGLDLHKASLTMPSDWPQKL
jgi:tetratricopeptide (TPR) repeat protein